MQITIAILGSSVLSALISGIFTLINNRKKAKSGVNKGVSLLLLGEMERLADKYTAHGSISRKELKWFLELHEVYKELGGDGYADDMKSDVTKLPVEVEA